MGGTPAGSSIVPPMTGKLDHDACTCRGQFSGRNHFAELHWERRLKRQPPTSHSLLFFAALRCLLLERIVTLFGQYGSRKILLSCHLCSGRHLKEQSMASISIHGKLFAGEATRHYVPRRKSGFAASPFGGERRRQSFPHSRPLPAGPTAASRNRSCAHFLHPGPRSIIGVSHREWTGTRGRR